MSKRKRVRFHFGPHMRHEDATALNLREIAKKSPFLYLEASDTEKSRKNRRRVYELVKKGEIAPETAAGFEHSQYRDFARELLHGLKESKARIEFEPVSEKIVRDYVENDKRERGSFELFTEGRFDKALQELSNAFEKTAVLYKDKEDATISDLLEKRKSAKRGIDVVLGTTHTRVLHELKKRGVKTEYNRARGFKVFPPNVEFYRRRIFGLPVTLEKKQELAAQTFPYIMLVSFLQTAKRMPYSKSTETARQVTNRMSVEDVRALSKHLGLAGQAGGLSSVETDFLVVAWLKKRGFIKPGELSE